jgi:predicted nucleic acid-binding protein
MNVVIDNSVTAAWVVAPQATPYSESVLARVRDASVVAYVPALWELEFSNLLRTFCHRGRIDGAMAHALLARTSALGMTVAREASPASELLGLALRHGLTTYDSAYLDLALRLQCPLATQDEAMRGAARACGVGVFAA